MRRLDSEMFYLIVLMLINATRATNRDSFTEIVDHKIQSHTLKYSRGNQDDQTSSSSINDNNNEEGNRYNSNDISNSKKYNINNNNNKNEYNNNEYEGEHGENSFDMTRNKVSNGQRSGSIDLTGAATRAPDIQDTGNFITNRSRHLHRRDSGPDPQKHDLERDLEHDHGRDPFRSTSRDPGLKCKVRRRVADMLEYKAAYYNWLMPRRYSCGVQMATPSAVVGGEEAPIAGWPWQVRLTSHRKGGKLCGGTVISDQWVLTAAHCMDSVPTAYMEFGLTRPAGSRQIMRRAAHYIIHPGYNASNLLEHDVALLRVLPPVEKSAYVFPACLPDSGLPASRRVLAGICYATGTGSTDGRTLHGSFPRRLQQVLVKPMSERECSRVAQLDQFSGKIYRPVRERHVCLQKDSPPRGTCVGDSGGPLSCLYNGIYYVAGITHYGEAGCKKRVFPDIFTRVSFYTDWIRATMKTHSKH